MPQSDSTPIPQALLFTGANCAPCKAVKPRVVAAATQAGYEFIEVPVEDDPSQSLVNQYQVSSVPVLVLRPHGLDESVARGMSDILKLLPYLK